MKKKILFVNQSQFGYHIDYLQYCRYLKNEFEITYICWDYGRNKMNEEGINIIYLSRQGNLIKRNISFIQNAIKHIYKFSYDVIFIHYFRGASLISILDRTKNSKNLDIRTGCVSSNSINRYVNNRILQFESKFFKNISIISEGLRSYIGINPYAYILPLGANPKNINKICKNRLHLLYVGTLTNRRIEDTIIGLNLFLEDNPKYEIKYTIVGEGWNGEKNKLEKLIGKLNLNSIIELKGYVPHDELENIYSICNVGVSYIPITPYFQYQPATKTYEYLLLGIPVIATKTVENCNVINESNGLLILDNPVSFRDALIKIYNNIDSYNEISIINTVSKNHWHVIINNLKEYIKNIN